MSNIKINLLRIVAISLMTTSLVVARPSNGLASDGVIRVGVLDDMSGAYADLAGEGSVVAARMAVEDMGSSVNGLPIELLWADHQNKADIGAAIARRWIDTEKVDVIVDILNSSVALAVQNVVRDRNKILIGTSIGAPDFTGKSCGPNSFLWTQDTYAITHGISKALTQQGFDTWYFIGVDYSFGHSLVDDATAAIVAAGGRVIGSAFHPLNEADYASYLLRAQASGAKVIALANAGHDMITAVKQAAEFGLASSGQKLVALIVYNVDLHGLGASAAQALTFSSPYSYEKDSESMAWAERFAKRAGHMPTLAQVSVYSAVRHYLRAVQTVHTNEVIAVSRAMHEMPVNDIFATAAHVRADGVLIHDMYIMQAKAPAETRDPWDVMKMLSVIAGGQAFRPEAESACPLLMRR